jgi:hypothetical protein
MGRISVCCWYPGPVRLGHIHSVRATTVLIVNMKVNELKCKWINNEIKSKWIHLTASFVLNVSG